MDSAVDSAVDSQGANGKAAARSGPKIGVLVPYTNVNLEPDMHRLCPSGCTMHFERMGGYDIDKIPGSEQMAGLGASDLSETIRLISGVRPAAVLYGCTSATLTHGSSFDTSLANNIRERSGAPSITAAGALIQSIRDLGVSAVGFSSPYVGEVNDQAMAFLNAQNISTVTCADIGRELDNYGQGELTPDEVYELALKADSKEAEAIVLSCTDMRSVEAVERIEARTGKPVITSNLALIFQLCKLLGLARPENAPGRLLGSL